MCTYACMCEIIFVRNHLFLIPLCSVVDLDRKLSLRRDRDELIKQGIIQPTEGEMLEDLCMYVRRYVHLRMVRIRMYVCCDKLVFYPTCSPLPVAVVMHISGVPFILSH